MRWLCGLRPGELAAAVTAPDTLFALRLSLLTSAAALAIALLLGLPAAYLMARWPFPGRALLDTLLDVPLVMPPLVAGLGLLFSLAGVVLALAFIATTVVLRSAAAAFRAVDPSHRAAARTLGAGAWEVFPLLSFSLLKTA